MTRIILALAALPALAGAGVCSEPPTPGSTPPAPGYWQDVRPVLRKHCTVCHSARHVKDRDVSGGVALDTFEAVKPRINAVLERVASSDPEKRMPQDGAPLAPPVIAVLRTWAERGTPEGNKPVAGPADGAAPTTGDRLPPAGPRHRHTLPVTLPTTAVPPAGLFGPIPAGKLTLSLPVGPLSPLTAVAYSPNGKYLASGSYQLVTVWDLTLAKPAAVLTGLLGAVNDLRFSPDGTLLAVAGGQPSARGDLRLYRVADWKPVASLGGHEDVVFGLAFSPDGKTLASASFDHTVRLWDVAAHKPLRTLTGHSDVVYAVAFSPDGGWLVSASKDRTVKLFDTATGRSRLTFSGTPDEVMAVAVSADGKSAVSAGMNPVLSWWDTATGQRTKQVGGHGMSVHELAMSRDGTVLASAGGDHTVRTWDPKTGAVSKVLSVGSMVYAVAVSPDGKRIAAGSFDGLVRVWDVAAGRHLLTLVSVPAGVDQAEWLALTPEGYADGSPGIVATLGRWEMSGKPVAAAPVWKAVRHPEVVTQSAGGAAVKPVAFGK